MVITMLASSLFASANENEREIELTTVENKAVVLKMSHLKEGTRISLRNEKGKVLFEEESTSDAYGKVFNLQQMEEGQLILEIESAESLEILPISVTKSSATMERSASVLIAKPLVRHDEEVLKVYLAKQCLEMQMTILDQYDDVVFRSQLAKSNASLKRFDISDLSSGQYRIQFSADGRSFYHTITLE